MVLILQETSPPNCLADHEYLFNHVTEKCRVAFKVSLVIMIIKHADLQSFEDIYCL